MNEDQKNKEKEVHLSENRLPSSEVEIKEGKKNSNMVASDSELDQLKKKTSFLRTSIFMLLFSFAVGLFTKYPANTDSYGDFAVFFVDIVNIAIFFEILYTNVFYRNKTSLVVFAFVIYLSTCPTGIILLPISRAISFIFLKDVHSNKFFKALVWFAAALIISLVRIGK